MDFWRGNLNPPDDEHGGDFCDDDDSKNGHLERCQESNFDLLFLHPLILGVYQKQKAFSSSRKSLKEFRKQGKHVSTHFPLIDCLLISKMKTRETCFTWKQANVYLPPIATGSLLITITAQRLWLNNNQGFSLWPSLGLPLWKSSSLFFAHWPCALCSVQASDLLHKRECAKSVIAQNWFVQ